MLIVISYYMPTVIAQLIFWISDEQLSQDGPYPVEPF